ACALPILGGGLSALGAGLYSLGIPKDSIVEYETALKSDQFLVMAYGTRDEVAQAQRLLEAAGAAQVAAYQATIPRETLAHEAFMHGNSCVVAGQVVCAHRGVHAEASRCGRAARRSGTAAAGGGCYTVRQHSCLTRHRRAIGAGGK